MTPESRPSRMDSYQQLADDGYRNRDTSDVYGDDEQYECCCSGRVNRRDEDDTLEFKGSVGGASKSSTVYGIELLYHQGLSASEIANKQKISRDQVLAMIRQNRLSR